MSLETQFDPAPLPEPLVRAAREVADDLSLPGDWLNNGPSSGDGGLFRLGLPSGFASRLVWRRYGEHLTVGFVGRVDQIHFKLYAAAWTRSHDPSQGYRTSLQRFLKEFGREDLADRV